MSLVDRMLFEMETCGCVQTTWCPRPAETTQVAPNLGERSPTFSPHQRSEQRYQAFVEHSSEGMWCVEFERPIPTGLPVDAQLDCLLDTGYVVEANDALARMYGHQGARCLVGQSPRLLLPADRSLLERFVKDGYRITDVETQTMIHSTERWLRQSLLGIVRDGALERVWGVQTDVSEHRRLMAQLRQAQKMEAVGQLAGGVAHDFNNLLTAILGYGEIVRDALGPQHDAAGDIEEILTAGHRAARLTGQLLAFSRRQVLRPEILDLNDVVREFEKMLNRLIGEHIILRHRLTSGLWLVRADRGQLEQVLLNLAVNARDAMSEGGTLSIETSNLDAVDALPVVGVGSRHVSLVVTDTGHGMTEDVRLRVFDPFFTTKGSGGTGLGLSTVYGIVEQSGGRIAVYSEPGLGTTFRVLLPAIEFASSPRTADSTAVDETPRGTERLLVVEDSREVRSVTVRILREHGYSVAEAESAEEALRLALTGDGVDVLLTDLVMPGLSGRALAELLSASRPRLRIVLTSGYGSASAAETSLGGRIPVFLRKPYSAPALLRAIREALDEPQT
jgi:two-component system cell cycle sensor histidine kinase/response regulator CckA